MVEAAQTSVARAGDRQNGAGAEYGRSWLAAGAAFAITLGLFAVLYGETVVWMARLWLQSQTYVHGVLVLPICGYLIWLRRQVLVAQQPVPTVSGLVALAAVVLLWFVAAAANITTLQSVAVTGMVPALVLSHFGAKATRVIAFPLGYLFFAVPLGESIVPRLQDLTASFAVKTLQISGIPVFHEGRFISTPTGEWEVIDACSGIRYLVAMLALASLFAYLNFRGTGRRIIFVLVAAGIALLANGVRAYGVIMLGHLSEMRLVQGEAHIVYGWILFAVVTVSLFWAGSRFSDRGRESSDGGYRTGATNTPGARWGHAVAGLAAMGVLTAGPIGIGYLYDYTQGLDEFRIAVTKPSDSWSSRVGIEDWSPVFPDADQYVARTFTRGDEVVYLYAALFSLKRRDAKLVSIQNTVYDGAAWRRIAESGRRVHVTGKTSASVHEIQMRSSEKARMIWHWYKVDDYRSSNRFIVKALESWFRIFRGREGGAVIALATDYQTSAQRARARLREVFEKMDVAITSKGDAPTETGDENAMKSTSKVPAGRMTN